MELKHIACIIGTRPEAIKMAPIILALKKIPQFKITLINTAQHRKLLDDMLGIFSLQPDIDCNIMQENQSLAMLTSRLTIELNLLFEKNKFDLVIAQGDTTTTLVSALVAFYNHIPFAHIEAGLRSYDMEHPFPEEINRILVSPLASFHFTPTILETNNLLKENINPHKIFTCGNSVIDALMILDKKNTPISFPIKAKRYILVTTHRRENFGEPVKNIFKALLEIVEKFNDIEIIYPVHLNPNVHQLAHNMLGNNPRIHLIAPMAYDEFVTLMKQAYLILTDSGGIQEEAPALNIPVLILRDVTERPLVVSEGMALLVGSDTNKIVDNVSRLLTNGNDYKSMQKGKSPYGDGHTTERVVKQIKHFFNLISS